MSINIGINGFGRIGRQILRIIAEENLDINIVAINGRSDLGTYKHLLKYLNNKKLEEMAAQEIEEDAHDYILSSRPDKVPYLDMESQGSLMEETKENSDQNEGQKHEI